MPPSAVSVLSVRSGARNSPVAETPAGVLSGDEGARMFSVDSTRGSAVADGSRSGGVGSGSMRLLSEPRGGIGEPLSQYAGLAGGVGGGESIYFTPMPLAQDC